MSKSCIGSDSLEKQAEIILAFAKALFVNGQTTTQVLRMVKKIAEKLHLNSLLIIRWGQLWIEVSNASGEKISCTTVADPVNVHMGRVIASMRILEDFFQANLTLEESYKRLTMISNQPPSPTGLFTLAAALGAVSLGVIFGVDDWVTVCLIFLSAALGALLRRYLARVSTNLFAQPLAASLIAGMVAGVVIHYPFTLPLSLIALCPCMVLVPGPHFLNSALDFIHGRMHLGVARLAFAGMICMSISLGVLVGLKLLGADLPIDPTTQHPVPLSHDMIAAGVAIAAYSVFFSIPLRLILWPLVVGVLAHMLRWQSLMTLNTSIAVASFLACLLVGIVLTLVAYYKRMPFAALAFSAVVSMIPGVFLFQMASGIVTITSQQNIPLSLLAQTTYEALNALVITLSISLGLLGPKLILDRLITRME